MWAALVAWFQSADGVRVLQGAVIPAVAIIVAGVIAGLIGRAAVRSALARADREQAAAVVAGMVNVARALVEQDADGRERRRRVERLRSEMDVRARLLPVNGAGLAADWAALRLEALQRPDGPDGSADESFDEFRNRLIAWTVHPRRAKTLFAKDVDRWRAAREGRLAVAQRSAAATPSAPAPQPAQRTDGTVSEAGPSAGPAIQAAPEPDDHAGRRRRSSGRVGGLDESADVGPAVAPATAAALPVATGGAVGAAPSEASKAVVATPAWRRARAAADARGGQEPARKDAQDDSPTTGDDLNAVRTAPTVVQHRAPGAPVADADEAVRQEAHLLARHSRTDDAEGALTAASAPVSPIAASAAATAPTQAAAPATSAVPAAPAASTAPAAPTAAPAPATSTTPAPAPAAPAVSAGAKPAAASPMSPPSPLAPIRPVPGAPLPAWLDTYDDEAEVTATLNLKTPPPVSATSVRGRSWSGEDIVPRQ